MTALCPLGDVVESDQGEEEEAREEEAGETQTPIQRVNLLVLYTLGLFRMLDPEEELSYLLDICGGRARARPSRE